MRLETFELCVCLTFSVSTGSGQTCWPVPAGPAANNTSASYLFAQLDVFEAAERYQREGIPLIILAGKDYGSGNSRDWVAKGPYLLVNCWSHSTLWANLQVAASTSLPLDMNISPFYMTCLSRSAALSSSSGGARGHRRELWEAAQEPASGNGHHATSVPSGPERRLPGAEREGEVHNHRARNPGSEAAAHCQGRRRAANPELFHLQRELVTQSGYII